MTGYVYALTTNDSEVFYIGSTKWPPEIRLSQHLKQKNESPVSKYIFGLGYDPNIMILEILENISNSIGLRAREKHWVGYYSDLGANLFNVVYNRPTERCMVNVKNDIRIRVQKFVIGTDYTIGSFYTIAAEEKLKRESK